MIKDLINTAITKMQENEEMNTQETLALALYLGGESVLTQPKSVLIDLINNMSDYSNIRNPLTILSATKNFIVGELFKIKKGESEIKVLTNIELLALMSSPHLKGETPMQILFDLPTKDIKDILINSRDSLLVFKEKEVITTKELFNYLQDMTTITDTEVVFYYNKECIVFINNEFGDIKYISDLEQSNSMFQDINSEKVEEIIEKWYIT